jgi:antitoxin VapB
MLAKTRRTTKLFVTNRTQAVRLPKELAFPPEVTEVEIIRQGSGVLIVPKGKGWDDYFDRGTRASDDFMVTRDQPSEAEEREPL